MAKKEPKEIKTESLPQEEDIIPVNTSNYQNKFLYGRSIEALDYNTWIKNKPTGSGIFAWSVTYTTTWVKTVSWVWFTPRLIRITATITSGAISHWVYYNSSVSCSYYYTGWGAGDASGNIGYSAYLDNAGNPTIATTVIPTTDGFTIVIANVNGGAITIAYECYG